MSYLKNIYPNNPDNSDNSDNSDNNPSSTAQFEEMQSRNLQTLNDIQGLQTIEKGLFTTLEAGLANNNISSDQQQKIIDKINQLSNMRVNLYKNLNGMYGFFQKNITSSRDTIAQQTAATDIIENELNEAKIRLKKIQQENNNKIRLVEINSYYGDKYADHASIMKLIVIFSIPILILTILANKGILPQALYVPIVSIIGVIAVFYIGGKIITTFSRDSMNYSEFDWNTKRSNLPSVDTDNPQGSNPWELDALMCSGSSCCPENFSYSKTQNKCIQSELLNEETSLQNVSSLLDSNKDKDEDKSGSNGYNYQMGGFGSL